MKYNNKKSSKKYNKKSSKKYNKKSSKKYNKKYTKKFSKKGGSNILYSMTQRIRRRFVKSNNEQTTSSNHTKRANLPIAYKQSSPVTGNLIKLDNLVNMGFTRENSIIALRHSDNDVNKAKNILSNLSILRNKGFTDESENSIIAALIYGDNDVYKAENILSNLSELTDLVNPNFTKDEANHFLILVEQKIGRLIDDNEIHKPRNNVKNYLIGEYNEKDHVSMFGSNDTFPNDGVGYFLENVLDGDILPTGPLSVGSIGFCNSEGENFRDHRNEALVLFRMAYNRLRKNSFK